MPGLRKPHAETPAEEAASVFTHALGAVLALAALVTLAILAAAGRDRLRIISLSIYGCTLVMMYLASTCYHLVRLPRSKRVLQIVDHASIYLLIAGTYTPVLLVTMRGRWGWTLFGVIWGIAIGGVILKLFFVGRYETLSVSLYIAMGWMVVIAAKPLLATMPGGEFLWLLLGGIAYTVGVIFYLWDSLPFNHAIWHLFVITGSVCHFLAMLLYVLPIR